MDGVLVCGTTIYTLILTTKSLNISCLPAFVSFHDLHASHSLYLVLFLLSSAKNIFRFIYF